MGVVPFPILTLKTIVPRDWESVLSLPLPRNPSLELLESARGQLLLCLDWLMTEMVLVDDPSDVRREIIRATDRLLEIAAILPDSMEVYAARGLTAIPPKHMKSVITWLNHRKKDGDD